MRIILNITIAFLLLFLSRNSSMAQPKTGTAPLNLEQPYKRLKIGEKVPDLVFHEMVNYSENTAKISDFKGKLLILDFWSSNCSFCIQLFPKIIELQGKFKDRAVILPIGTDFPTGQRATIKSTIKRISTSKYALTIPTAIEYLPDTARLHDGRFYHLFGATAFPHIVWINSEGYLCAITGYEAVTEKNIEGMLSGAIKAIPKRVIELPLQWKNNEFLIKKIEKAQHPKGYSVFHNYIDSLAAGMPQLRDLLFDQRSPGNWHLATVNTSAIRMYLEAYGDTFPELISSHFIGKTRVINETTKPDGYTNETVPPSPLQTVPSELRFEKNKKLLCRSAP